MYSYALSCIRCGFSENTGYLKQPINIPKQYINTSKPLPIHPLGENATHGPNNLLTSLNNPLTPLKPIKTPQVRRDSWTYDTNFTLSLDQVAGASRVLLVTEGEWFNGLRGVNGLFRDVNRLFRTSLCPPRHRRSTDTHSVSSVFSVAKYVHTLRAKYDSTKDFM